MAKKRLIKVNALAFHLAVERLKELEKENKAISFKGKRFSNFLIGSSDFETSDSSIANEVKITILKTKGFDNPDPSTLSDSKKMEDFEFSGIQYLRLTRRFNNIAKAHNPDAKDISVASVQGCETVKDCIDLVTTAAATASFIKNLTL